MMENKIDLDALVSAAQKMAGAFTRLAALCAEALKKFIEIAVKITAHLVKFFTLWLEKFSENEKFRVLLQDASRRFDLWKARRRKTTVMHRNTVRKLISHLPDYRRG